MKLFFFNLRKYKHYTAYSAVASLRAEVNGSFLNWLWWILDPLLFMMVYSFVSMVVFGRTEPHFIPFVFAGYGTWQFFNRTVSTSVKLIRGSKSVLSRIYLPKYILLFSRMFKYFIQFMITVGLTVGIGLIDRVRFSWYVLYFPVVVFVMIVLTFGVSCITMHIGVYARDFSNILTVVLKLIFYLSGIFYSIPKRIPDPWDKILLTVNPAAMLINEMRNILIYAQAPNIRLLGSWLLIGLCLVALGVGLIQKYEQNYVKSI